MELGLQGKTVLVTGGSSGLGLTTARRFLEEGARVAICGRDRQRLDAAVDDLRKTGERVHGAVANVDVPEEIARLVEGVVETFGGLDIVVSNAGTHLLGTIEEVTVERLEQHFRTKVFGLWELARQIIPPMRVRGGGKLIVIIGQAAKVPGEQVIASAAVNLSQHAVVKSLADYLGKDNILVNAVCPSRIASPLTAQLALQGEAYLGLSLQQQQSGWGRDVPMGRRGVPEDVANAVLFVASGRADFLCGASIDVDGGYQRSIL